MKGPLERMIRQRGEEYTVRNATGGSGRESPSYSDDGSVTGVIERRGQPRVTTDSAGEDVEVDLEIRVADTSGTTITESGASDSYPTRLIHPDGNEYVVLEAHPEDSNVTVLSVVRD